MAGRCKISQINCQCGAREDDLNPKGCNRCGGSGLVLVQHECGECDRLYWVRPIVQTIYRGKKETTFDGLELVYKDPTKPPVCIFCVMALKDPGILK